MLYAMISAVDLFLSTPSARRATCAALAGSSFVTYFYPRPPRGGRPEPIDHCTHAAGISIHALREEGDQRPARFFEKRYYFYPRPPRGGRRLPVVPGRRQGHFYPRPPRGGRPKSTAMTGYGGGFLSTPSARRATKAVMRTAGRPENFYPRPPRGGRLLDY